MAFLSLSLYARALTSYECFNLGPGDFPVSYSNRDTSTLEMVIQKILWSIRGSYSVIWKLPLTNVKCHSDPRPATANSIPIRLLTNFITMIPNLTFTELRVVSMEHLQGMWHASWDRLPFQTSGSVPFGTYLCSKQVLPNLCLFSTFHLKYPSVLSRFCLLHVCVSRLCHTI